MSRTTLKAYAVKDIQSQLFTAPHFLMNDTVAIRSFEAATLDPSTQFNKYPGDFSMYYIGGYNIESGELTKEEPKQIANASQFINNQ
jgi:hypothetical protein